MSVGHSQEVVLLGLGTVTTNGGGISGTNAINLPMGYSACLVTLDVLTVSGTSPTLNVYVQEKLTFPAYTDTPGIPPTGNSYFVDTLAFATMTTTIPAESSL